MKPAPYAALLGPGAQFVGELRFEGRVRVDGSYRGGVHTEDTLEVGPQGRVDGKIDVANLEVAGVVSGEIRVKETLRVAAGGMVKGELWVRRLELEPGARVDAYVRLNLQERS